MHIKVIGGSKDHRHAIRLTLTWCAARLFTKKMSSNIEVLVVIKDLKEYGNCTWEDDNLRPREFAIEVRKGLTQRIFIRTLIHEMVHVRQYALRQLKELYKGGHRVLWKNRDYTDANYDDMPHEREAMRLEKRWYKDLIKEVDFSGVSITPTRKKRKKN